MLTVEQKIEHLRKLGLDSDMTEIEKMYRGKEFNIHDDAYKKLLELSQKYCIRFTQLFGNNPTLAGNIIIGDRVKICVSTK